MGLYVTQRCFRCGKDKPQSSKYFRYIGRGGQKYSRMCLACQRFQKEKLLAEERGEMYPRPVDINDISYHFVRGSTVMRRELAKVIIHDPPRKVGKARAVLAFLYQDWRLNTKTFAPPKIALCKYRWLAKKEGKPAGWDKTDRFLLRLDHGSDAAAAIQELVGAAPNALKFLRQLEQEQAVVEGTNP